MAPKPDDVHQNPDGQKTRPGAQYITNDEATRFDERIAEKRNKNNNSNQNRNRNNNNAPTASASTTAAAGTVAAAKPRMIEDDNGEDEGNCKKPAARPSSSNSSNNSREMADRAAKNRARGSAFSTVLPVKRDPLASYSSSQNRIDEDIQAKQRAKSSYCKQALPGSVQSVRGNDSINLNTSHSSRGASMVEALDRDIEAKNQARRSIIAGDSSHSVVARKPAALTPTTTMRNNQRNEAAKNRARSSDGPALIPGAMAVKTSPSTTAATNNRDQSSKNRARSHDGPALIPGAMAVKTDPSSADATAATKTSTNCSNNSDDDIVVKNRARSHDGPAVIPGAFEERSGGSNSDKNGVQKDIHFGGQNEAWGTMDVDALAKRSASMRYIHSTNDDDMFEKKIFSAGAQHGVGALALGGSPEEQKKLDGTSPYYSNEDAAVLTGKIRAAGGGGGHTGTGPTLVPSANSAVGPGGFTGRDFAGGMGEDNGGVNSVSATAAAAAAFGLDHDTVIAADNERGMGEIATMNMTIDDVEFNDLEDNKLAVARAVIEEEEDEDVFIPAAVEYDPDAKPPMYKNRRFRLYGFLGFLMVLVAIVAIVIPTKVTMRDDYSGPTMAPTTFRESLGIQEQIEKFVGSSKLYDPDTPHYKALDWLLHYDAMQLPPDAENLLQRYILALFYFQTSMDGPWRSCNPPMGNETAECQYENILSIIPLTYESQPAIRWLSDRSECEWVGVACEGNRTVMMAVRGQKLSGTFPEELEHLTFLRSLNFAWNELSGPLPKSMSSKMKHLINIELHSNFLNGTIPSEFFKFENLIRFNLGTNRLTGTLPIPPDDTSQSLKGIFLFENLLTGTIPTEISKFSSLSYLRLNKNFITGSLPSELGLMTNLQELWMHTTPINGTIPTEIGELDKLQDLRLHQTDLSGELPDEFYDLKVIDRLDLFDANFSGTISTKIGQLTTLDVLRMRDNNFYGELPSEVGLLTELRQVWIHHNEIHGKVPAGMCQLRNESILMELVADCIPSENSGFALLDCPEGCCTACCDAETKACVDLSQSN